MIVFSAVFVCVLHVVVFLTCLRQIPERDKIPELRYPGKTYIFGVVRVGEECLFRCRVAQCWTPHSGWNILPSAARALDVDKADRDMLGGWAAQECDAAKARIANVQKEVSTRPT